MRFNPPPGWPSAARPPLPGWTPDPRWPAPPPGWAFWVDDAGRPVAPPPGAWSPVPAPSAAIPSAPTPAAHRPQADGPQQAAVGASVAPLPASARRPPLWLLAIAGVVVLALLAGLIVSAVLTREHDLDESRVLSAYRDGFYVAGERITGKSEAPPSVTNTGDACADALLRAISAGPVHIATHDSPVGVYTSRFDGSGAADKAFNDARASLRACGSLRKPLEGGTPSWIRVDAAKYQGQLVKYANTVSVVVVETRDGEDVLGDASARALVKGLTSAR